MVFPKHKPHCPTAPLQTYYLTARHPTAALQPHTLDAAVYTNGALQGCRSTALRRHEAHARAEPHSPGVTRSTMGRQERERKKKARREREATERKKETTEKRERERRKKKTATRREREGSEREKETTEKRERDASS